MEWKNVNEILPKEGNNYLCFLKNGFIKMCFYNDKEWFDMWETTLNGEVTYWMPLPKSPYANNPGYSREKIMEDERQEPISEKMKYTVKDMFAAFRHGRNFESLNVDFDIDFTGIDEKHRPFFEWLKIYKE